MSENNVVYFKRTGSMVECQCGKFTIDLFVVSAGRTESMLEHAKTHNPTQLVVSISIVDDFDQGSNSGGNSDHRTG